MSNQTNQTIEKNNQQVKEEIDYNNPMQLKQQCAFCGEVFFSYTCDGLFEAGFEHYKTCKNFKHKLEVLDLLSK